MARETAFERAYNSSLGRAAASANDHDMTAEKYARMFGEPGSIFALETTLVAMMLIQPDSEASQRALKMVRSEIFLSHEHRSIWKALQAGAKSVSDIAFRSWTSAGRSEHELPDDAYRALVLMESGNWISAAGIESWAVRLVDIHATERIKQRILDASRELLDGTLTPQECLDRLAILREQVATHGS